MSTGRAVLTCASLGAVMLWAPGVASQETALDFPTPGAEAAQDNLTLAVTQADGSVDVVLAQEPATEHLDRFLDLLVIGTASQVRFSATYDMPGRRETLDRIEAFSRENGLGWSVCHDWWLSPDADYLATAIRDTFGGSLVFIDNGATSDAVDNPDADLGTAMRADPAYAAVLSSAPRRISDAGEYLDGVMAVWIQIVPTRELDAARQSKGGWLDGC